MTKASHARLSINLGNLVQNWQSLNARSGERTETSAVIKADGYGLGIEAVAGALVKAGCKTFFVAVEAEGIRVRKVAKDARILVFNGISPEATGAAKRYRLTPVLSCPAQLSYQAENTGKFDGCAIHVDTGMNRLGLSAPEAEALSKNTALLEKLAPEVLMSHLACADETTHTKNREQLSLFNTLSASFPKMQRSLANSAGIMLSRDYHFDLTRPGIALYGGEAQSGLPNPMKPVVLAEARILQIRSAIKGETVGYGASYTLTRDTKIAVVAAGYADGFHRAMSGSGVAARENNSSGGIGAIGAHKVPILGRVSMDLTTFDVSDVPQAILDKTDWIEFFGKQIPLDEAARKCGTIGYELLTSLGQRYQRHYLEN